MVSIAVYLLSYVVSLQWRSLSLLISSLFLVVKWETEQATVKLLDDVSSGEVEETEEPEGDENVCDETKSILDSKNLLESKSIVESKSLNMLSNKSKSILENTEQSSETENEPEEDLGSDNKEE